jgi:hypothetical protein
MAKPQRFCLFCKGPGLTREHIWADWLRNYIPRDLTEYHLNHRVDYRTHVNSDMKKFSGDPRSRRLPVVCLDCNQGWMSKLQEDTKPVLIPLILGKPTKLRRSHQRLLAAWITMAVMVGEHVVPSSAVIAQSERSLFMLTLQPPRRWRIWVGHYRRGEWIGHWVHNAVPLVLQEDLRSGKVGIDAPKNTQETTFTVGELYIRAFSSSIDVDETWVIPPNGDEMLVSLIPPRQAVVRWPMTRVLTDQEADVLANWFFNASRRVRSSVGQ